MSDVPLPGDAEPPDSFVGPAAAEAGATMARSSATAIPHAPKVAVARPRRCRASRVRERDETAWDEVGLGILFARMA